MIVVLYVRCLYAAYLKKTVLLRKGNLSQEYERTTAFVLQNGVSGKETQKVFEACPRSESDPY